ncbi:MAG: hypothetical protein VX600_00110 [Candidatus Neomarinimicrobiota bacterium]|nr:hypothetical protein [Candidatus Neomarinimicrobiota bacterium]
MGPINLYFDFRDIFRAPRLALSGKKIWILIVGNLAGYILYWIFTYLSLLFASDIAFGDAVSKYGLYPCLFGNDAPTLSWIIYFIGIEAWIIAIFMSCTAVARVTLKQLKGNDFFSAKDAWHFVYKHWHPVVFTPISVALIILFFLFFAAIFALFGKIPVLGEFLFTVLYLFYFFGSVFTVYTLFVLLVAFVYTPAIVSAYEEDTMGTVFQSYSITWSQPWRLIFYHFILVPIALIGVNILAWFWRAGFQLINYVFGCDWFMGEKLDNVLSYASSLVYADWMSGMPDIADITSVTEISSTILPTIASFAQSICIGLTYLVKLMVTGLPNLSYHLGNEVLSGTEIISGIILSIAFFLILLSVLSYGLSILSVGETIMFVIFKKNSDDDNLLERKDEDEFEEENDETNFDFDDDDNNGDSKPALDKNSTGDSEE